MGQGQGGLVYWSICIHLFINWSNRLYATDPTTESSQWRKYLEDIKEQECRTLEQKLQEVKRKERNATSYNRR